MLVTAKFSVSPAPPPPLPSRTLLSDIIKSGMLVIPNCMINKIPLHLKQVSDDKTKHTALQSPSRQRMGGIFKIPPVRNGIQRE